jgi:hypothetical protein
LTPPGQVNAAGHQYHMPESNTRYDFTVADMVAAGIAPATILSLDNQMRAMAEQMVAWAKAKAAAAPTPPEPVAPEPPSTEG